MIVILLAAGSSTRFGYHIKKQNLTLNNKSVMQNCIDNLNYDFIKNIILVTNDDIEFNSDKVIIVKGGNSRIESLINAYNFLKENINNDEKFSEIILVHDAARPLIYKEILDDLSVYTNQFNACGVYKELVSSILESSDRSYVTDVIKRKNYVESHTPQAFKFWVLDKIFSNINTEEIKEETELLNLVIKYCNFQPKILKGDDRLLKLTYINDYSNLSNISKTYKKKVLITGCTGDISQVIIEYLLLFEFEIILVGRNRNKIQEILQKFNNTKIIDHYVCDFNNALEVEFLTTDINHKYDIDIVILGHGVIKFGKLNEFKNTDITELINVNYVNNILFLKKILDNKNIQTVINISSSSIDKSRINQQIYSSSKIAMHLFIKSLALEYKDLDVYFYNIVPRRTDTKKRKELINTDEDLLDPKKIAKAVYNCIIMSDSGTSGNDIYIT